MGKKYKKTFFRRDVERTALSESGTYVTPPQRAREVFRATTNTLSVSLFKSLQFGHLYRK